MGLAPRFPFSRIVCTLIGAYCLLNELDWLPENFSGDLIFPVILVLLGVSLLADAFRKSRKPRFKVVHKGGNGEKTKCDCSTGNDSFHCDLCFGENTHFVSVPVLRSGEASLSFGELTIDLRDCEEIADGCAIDASCAFGELRFLVPSRFQVKHQGGTVFAAVNISGHPDPEPQGIIDLDASASFGEISIQYV